MDSCAAEQMKKYRREAKEKWGGTAAYRAYEAKEKAGKDFSRAGDELMALFADLGTCRALPPDSPAVQEKIAALQKMITENFYPCTREILQGLGQMYTQDERFRKNIDAAGGEGTAAFEEQAIEIYCAEK